MYNICFFTSTRAEYGLLKPLMTKTKRDALLRLQLLVSGTHLSPEFGYTRKFIEQDGFEIDEAVECLMSSDSSDGLCKSIGLGVIGYSSAMLRLKPALVFILGDRYEALAAATAAIMHRVPIAHIHGGETTEGAVDELIRHSITKMSSLHFTSTEIYRKRVVQLGEHPERVFNVGALGIEIIKESKLLSIDETERKLGVPLKNRSALVTFHPATLSESSAEIQFAEIIKALRSFPDMNLIFTYSNSDAGGRVVNEMIKAFVKEDTKKRVVFASMGQKLYLSTLSFCDLIIGNSSSGLIEAPSLHIPTVNIGDRQKGRVRADSVIDAESNCVSIIEAISTAITAEFKAKTKSANNPYQKENTSEYILTIVRERITAIQTKKIFFDLLL